jgi:Raf kinase inhibitor-like YbhB/YbcL family protein
VPKEAKSLALVMDDPDAPMGTFDHWVVWNILHNARSIKEGKEPEGAQGTTSFGKLGYGRSCPSSGEHRYFFKLCALDAKIDLPEGSGNKDLEKAIKGHIIEQAILMGKYNR